MTITQQITEALDLKELLLRANRNLDGFVCREDCEFEPSCRSCYRLAHALDRLERRITGLDELLDSLAAEADQEELRGAEVDARIQCEYCTAPWHADHSCYGTFAEASEARRIEEEYR